MVNKKNLNFLPSLQRGRRKNQCSYIAAVNDVHRFLIQKKDILHDILQDMITSSYHFILDSSIHNPHAHILYVKFETTKHNEISPKSGSYTMMLAKSLFTFWSVRTWESQMLVHIRECDVWITTWQEHRASQLPARQCFLQQSHQGPCFLAMKPGHLVSVSI